MALLFCTDCLMCRVYGILFYWYLSSECMVAIYMLHYFCFSIIVDSLEFIVRYNFVIV